MGQLVDAPEAPLRGDSGKNISSLRSSTGPVTADPITVLDSHVGFRRDHRLCAVRAARRMGASRDATR